jgi:hypothetical protein
VEPLVNTLLFLAVEVSAAPSSAVAARTTRSGAPVPSPLPIPASLVISRARTLPLLLLPAPSPLPTLATARSKQGTWFETSSSTDVLCLVGSRYSIHSSVATWPFAGHQTLLSSCYIRILRMKKTFFRTISPLSCSWLTHFLLDQSGLMCVKH